MISGKGLIYTVLAASSAAVLVGTMLTKRSGGLQKMTDGIQNFLGSMKNKIHQGPGSQMQKAEFDQANSMGQS